MLAIQTKLHGAKDWRVTDARLALAHTDKLSQLTAEERGQLAQAKGLEKEVHTLYRQGKYPEAAHLQRQALAIHKKALGPDHPDTAQSLNNLGALLKAQGDYAGARPYDEQALAIRKKALGPDHPDTAQSLNNLAYLLQAQGEYAGARPYLEQALAIYKKVLGPEHPDTAISLNNLGYLLKAQGDYPGARPYLEQALAIYKKALGPDHPDMAISLNNLGYLLKAQGDYAGARPYYEQALAITGKNLALAAAGQSERQQLAMARSLREYLDAYLSLAPRADIPGDPAYRPLLRWKGAVRARQQTHGLDSTDPDIASLVAQRRSASSKLAKLAFAVPPVQQQAAWRRQLEELSREKERLEAELSRRSAAFRRQQELQALTPEQLRKALPPGTALVDFLEYTKYSEPPEGKGKLRTERHLAAFVVRPDRPVGQLDLGPAPPIEAAVEAWRKRFLQGATDMEGNPAATLRRLVWEPLEPHLKEAPTVLLSPDGALARLPFAALPGKEPGSYLLEERALAVLPVPQLLPLLLDNKEPARAPEPSLLLVADVDYGAASGPTDAVADSRAAPLGERGSRLRWSALPGTRAEMTAIRDSFEQHYPAGSVHLLRKAQATEHAVRTRAGRSRYLHLATHGFFAPPQLKSALAVTRATAPGPADLFREQDVTGFHPGLLSGLVLAGANQPVELGKDDGILTALEVAALDLSGVELAVLSACETGLGETAGGEGLLGMQRAFQVAGAQSVVASLWKVDDGATRQLMIRFYENLWNDHKPLGKLAALREAQLWMLKEGVQRGLVPLDEDKSKAKAGRTPPRYWAAFVLSGDWR